MLRNYPIYKFASTTYTTTHVSFSFFPCRLLIQFISCTMGWYSHLPDVRRCLGPISASETENRPRKFGQELATTRLWGRTKRCGRCRWGRGGSDVYGVGLVHSGNDRAPQKIHWYKAIEADKGLRQILVVQTLYLGAWMLYFSVYSPFAGFPEATQHLCSGVHVFDYIQEDLIREYQNASLRSCSYEIIVRSFPFPLIYSLRRFVLNGPATFKSGHDGLK